MRNRFFEEIPFVRAIACIMVVLVHFTAGTITNSEGSSNYLNLYLYQLTRLGTPMFAVISAFLLFSSVKQRGFDLKRFLSSRTTKIIFPFVLWTFFYLGVKHYYGKEVFIDAEGTMKYFVLGSGYYHLYFMITVIQFYLFFPLLQLIRKRIVLLILFFLSLPLNAYWLNNPGFTTDIELLNIVIHHRSFVLNWAAFFLFGGVLAYYYQEILTYIKKHKLFFAAIAVSIFIAQSIEIDPEHIYTSSRPINLIYVPLFVLFLLSTYQLAAKNPFMNKGIKVIGNYSMGIYLVHPFIRAIFRDYLPAEYWQPNLILFTTALGIVVSMGIIRLILFLPVATYIVPVGKATNTGKSTKEVSTKPAF